MMRFVDLRNQSTGYRFAFWNTVIDRFVSIDNEQAWEDLEDLQAAAKLAGENVDRLITLCPDWVQAEATDEEMY